MPVEFDCKVVFPNICKVVPAVITLSNANFIALDAAQPAEMAAKETGGGGRLHRPINFTSEREKDATSSKVSIKFMDSKGLRVQYSLPTPILPHLTLF